MLSIAELAGLSRPTSTRGPESCESTPAANSTTLITTFPGDTPVTTKHEWNNSPNVNSKSSTNYTNAKDKSIRCHCGREFKTRKYLQEHVKRWNRKTRLNCPEAECKHRGGDGFLSQLEATRHYKRCHKDSPPHHTVHFKEIDAPPRAKEGEHKESATPSGDDVNQQVSVSQTPWNVLVWRMAELRDPFLGSAPL